MLQQQHPLALASTTKHLSESRHDYYAHAHNHHQKQLIVVIFLVTSIFISAVKQI